MADGSRQSRDWDSGGHMRAHGELGKDWFGKWEDPETQECLSALTQQLQRGIHHTARGMISNGRWQLSNMLRFWVVKKPEH